MLLTACAAAPPAPLPVPAPPAQLADIPSDAEGEFATCVEGTQVAIVRYMRGGLVYRLIFAPLTRAWMVVAFDAGRVWLGTATEAGVLIVAHTLTLEDAKARYPDPCTWLEREAV